MCDLSCKQKFRKAAEAYTGEKDEKAIFDNVLTPLAKEYGLSATFEEFKEYAGAFSGGTDGELSEDELSQVAGGKGYGAWGCFILGAGGGSTSSNDWCMVFGLGMGVCMFEGVSAE